MSVHNIKLSPSILSADFAKLGQEVADISAAGADYIHVDVMDGHFVPNLTIGPIVVKALRPHSSLPFDVHLMIEQPEKYIDAFAEAGADLITVHYEACDDLPAVIEKIRAAGVKVGLSIKPDTPAEVLKPILEALDLVLVMTVYPGFGGQAFMSCQLEKIQMIREWINASGKTIELEVDGGINTETAPLVIEAGADVLVAGSASFKGGVECYADNLKALLKSG